MTSRKQREANDKAFQKGQQDFRNGKSRDENFYPPNTGYADLWEQGWDQERKASYE